MNTRELVEDIKEQLEVLKNHTNVNGEKLIDLGTKYYFDAIEYDLKELETKANLFEVVDRNARNLELKSDVYNPVDQIFSFEVEVEQYNNTDKIVFVKGVNDDYNTLVSWAVNKLANKLEENK